MSDMTIKQVVAAKAEAERQIEAIVDRFMRESGVRVTGIDVVVHHYEDIAGLFKKTTVRGSLRTEV